MALLRRTIRTQGATAVRLVQADLLRPLPFSRPFDCVLVDAPCSGLGILRRDPDIRWRRAEDDLPSLAAAQLVMLQHASEAVAEGGRLIYATCSSEPEENESVADAFLIVRSVLTTYNADSPFVPLTAWDGFNCSNCGRRGDSGEAGCARAATPTCATIAPTPASYAAIPAVPTASSTVRSAKTGTAAAASS